jgi:hypothetical protein
VIVIANRPFKPSFLIIAVTNLIKCNTSGENSSPLDQTPEDIRKHCSDSRIFEKEIKIMEPKHIIFLTGDGYDNEILKMDLFNKAEKDEMQTINTGNKIVWWTGRFSPENEIKYYMNFSS